MHCTCKSISICAPLQRFILLSKQCYIIYPIPRAVLLVIWLLQNVKLLKLFWPVSLKLNCANCKAHKSQIHNIIKHNNNKPVNSSCCKCFSRPLYFTIQLCFMHSMNIEDISQTWSAIFTQLAVIKSSDPNLDYYHSNAHT